MALPASQGSQDDEEHLLTREEELEGSAEVRPRLVLRPRHLGITQGPGAFVSIPLTCTLWFQFTFAHKPICTLPCAHDNPPALEASL